MKRYRINPHAPDAFDIDPAAQAILDNGDDDAAKIAALVAAGFDPASAVPLVALFRLIADKGL